GFNMFEPGAGQLNVDGAVRLARLVKPTLPTSVGSALLTAALPTQQSTISGYTFKWGQGVITNHGFLYGSALMNYWQGVYGSGVVLGDGAVLGDGTVLSDGVVLCDNTTRADLTLKSSLGANVFGDNTAAMQP